MFLVSSCSCLWPILWRKVLSREWRCSWSGTDRRYSNYISVTVILSIIVRLILQVDGTSQMHLLLIYDWLLYWPFEAYSIKTYFAIWLPAIMIWLCSRHHFNANFIFITNCFRTIICSLASLLVCHVIFISNKGLSSDFYKYWLSAGTQFTSMEQQRCVITSI